MGKKSLFRIVPPLAGVNKRTGYQSIPPYSTDSCLNVRSIDVTDKRTRVGKRPGLTKQSTVVMGGIATCRALGNFSYTAISVSSVNHYTLGYSAWSDGSFWAENTSNVWSLVSATTAASLNSAQYT